MNSYNIKNFFRRGAWMALVPALLTVTACSEDIDESNLYTFTGETIEDFLTNRPDSFSSFNYIIQKAGMDKILSAYGQYTCFAPLNAQMDAYVDSLYNDSTQDNFNPHNGMTGPGLEGLTDSLCRDIAMYHLVSEKLLLVNMGSQTINTMLGRPLENQVTVNDSTGNVTLNRSSEIISADNEVENGVVQVLNRPLTRSNLSVADELSRHSDYSLFTDALLQTGLADSISGYVKDGYIKAASYLNYYVPDEIHLGYTIFAESNRTLAANGINNFNDLVAYANRVYGDCAEWYNYVADHNIQVSTGNDYTNKWNCLNMFMRYHLLNTKVAYTNLVIGYVENSNNNFNGMPLYEYYETMLPYTLMKVSKDAGEREMYINKAVANSTLTNTVPDVNSLLGGFGTDDMHQVLNQGVEVMQFNGSDPLNGYIHQLSGMLVYDRHVPQQVLNERMRFDVASLLGEMASNNFRRCQYSYIRALNGGKSGGKDGSIQGDYIRCGEGMFDHLRIYNGNETRLYYLSGVSNGWNNYQKDEFNSTGSFDFALRLPPVPNGTYELRLGFHANDQRGMVQCFLGVGTNNATEMTALDIPIDMRIMVNPGLDGTPDVTTGWNDWRQTQEGDMGVTTDRNMHNLGWMRGPLCFGRDRSSTTSCARTSDDRATNGPVLRRILARREFKQGDYWLRFKTSLPENTTSQFHLDYIELCPSTVYNSSQYLEDMY